MVVYKHGDVLDSDCKVICHQVNCRGVINGDLSRRIIRRYPTAYKAFRLREIDERTRLGTIDLTRNYDQQKEKDIIIANLYAQRDYLPLGEIHTNYKAFRRCLRILKRYLNGKSHYKVGFPAYIGCDEAGGNWTRVSSIIEEEFRNPKWNVEIWDDAEA